MHRFFILSTWLILTALLVSCSTGGGELPTATPIAGENTEEATLEPATATSPPTPTTPPRRLTICMAEEPETLFIYGGDSPAQRHVLQAIYDGPIDRVGYQVQPVILEKLPSLADGDAVIESLPVAEGDLIVNAEGQLVRLDLDELVRPYGCASEECTVPWDGSALELPQLSATFTLKPNLVWADSTPLTAADSVYSYQVASQCEIEFGNCAGLGLPSRSGRDILLRTATYSALDDRSIRWTGIPGFMDSAYQENFFIPLPEHQLASYSVQDLFTAPESSREPLGWGPYSIQRWMPGESITLRANSNYYKTHEQDLQFDELLFLFVGESTGNMELILSAACDIIDQTASKISLENSFEEINQMEADGQLQAHYASGPAWEHVDFGIEPISYDDGYLPGVERPDFFSDIRVRQAFAMCMDRERIDIELLGGLSSIPTSYLPAEHPLNNPTLMLQSFNPQAGGELLQEAGWLDHDADPQTPRQATGIQGVVDGTPLVVTYITSSAEQRLDSSQLLADSLEQCGIQVEVNSGTAEQVYAPGPDGPVFGRRFDLAQFAWSDSAPSACQLWTSRQVPGDPNRVDDEGNSVFPFGWGGVNAGGFRDNEYDLACEEAFSTLPGQPGYVENQHAVQSIFSQQLPVVPLFQHLSLALSRVDMCGFSLDPSAFSEFWNIENFDYGPGCQ